MAEWDEDISESGGLVGHYYEAIGVAVDAERLLQKGGALAAIVAGARDEAVDSIVFIIQTPDLTSAEMAVHRERVKVYEALIRSLLKIMHEGDEASSDLAAIDGEALETIAKGENDVEED